jgi:FkbM family methyltransferase
MEALLAFHTRQAGLVAIDGHTVLIGALHPGAVVVDVGAHTGGFTRPLLDLGCTCYAVEPVAGLLAQLADQPGLLKFCRAITARDGEVLLHLSRNPQANSVFDSIARRFGSAGTITARSTTLAAFLDEIGVRELAVLKLDIEGSELSVLESMPEDLPPRIGQISVEFHDFLDGFGAADSVRRIKRRLSRAGFLCVVLSRPDGHHADTLFVNRRRIALRPSARLHLLLMGRFTAPLHAGLRRLAAAVR